MSTIQNIATPKDSIDRWNSSSSAPETRPVSTVSMPHRRLSIAHVTLGTDIGGMEKLLVEFVKHSNRELFSTTVYSLQAPGRLAEAILAQGSEIESFFKKPGLRLGVLWRLYRRLRATAPDVVHTHNTAGFFYGATAATLAGIPRIIHTRHGQRITATSRQNAIFRLLSKTAYRVVSVSEDSKKRCLDEGVDAEKAIAIRNGIDLSSFPYTGFTPSGPLILVARLSPEKGIQTLIEAVQIVASESHPNERRIQLQIVGDGSQRRLLESHAHSKGIADCIDFMGARADVPSLLANASMFVLPSLSEGISLTLLEAMASGLPVIATRVGGNPEVVVDNESGILVPPQDPRALAKAIIRLRTDRSLCSRLSRDGRSRVEQHFSIQGMIHRYESLYLEPSR
jgi:sugar transferase (PEP-CTERM/EpsH1 system associated)